MSEPNAPTPYLPQECIDAINATDAKTTALINLWSDYISNLKNNSNHIENIHSLNHVKDITNQHLSQHKLIRLQSLDS